MAKTTASRPARKPHAEPSDKLLEILANELLDGGKDRITVEGIEAKYPQR